MCRSARWPGPACWRRRARLGRFNGRSGRGVCCDGPGRRAYRGARRQGCGRSASAADLMRSARRPRQTGRGQFGGRPMSFLDSDDPHESQEAVFRFLADPKTHGLSEPVERVDTAGAVVFLAGADVYKVKRAVKFPFMDLSTLDKRREACEAEIEVNRASAPQIYLSALPDHATWRDASRSGATAKSSNGPSTCGDSTRTPRLIASPIGAAFRTRSSTSSRSRPPYARSRPAQGCSARRACARDLYRAERRRFRRMARSLRLGRRRASSPTIRGSHSRSCARSCSSAARPVSFAAVTAICI